ncbi:MAG TPA: FKBP-type peptidyl-prolyl cis-trans isomerase [Mucilaginibacter sp.]|nr:FKBP-type peptidyl-prolyl cis-trans isomerase [Mucilaginibacter sp.]
MKKRFIFLAVAAIGLASCNSGFKEAPGGMLYDIHVDKGGPKIQQGDFISVDLVVKTDGDSLLFSTYQQGHPQLAVLPKLQTHGDIMSAFEYLAEGDSATIKTNIDSVYKKRKPPIKGKYVIYEVKVEKVISKGKLSDSAFNNRVQDYLKVQAVAMSKQEPKKIQKYIADHKLKMSQTPSGLYYVITDQGKGEKPAEGDTAMMNYTVRFTDNKLLETNVKDVAVKENKVIPMAHYKPLPIVIDSKGAIQGVVEGLELLNKGGKATLVVPSKLAYGEQGMGNIGPYTPLVFEIELVNIIHPNPNAPKPAALTPVQAQVKKPGSK